MSAAQFISGSAAGLRGSARRRTVPFYLGLAQHDPGLVGALAPLLGGFLGVYWLPHAFAISSVVALAGWAVYRFGVNDPRATKIGRD